MNKDMPIRKLVIADKYDEKKRAIGGKSRFLKLYSNDKKVKLIQDLLKINRELNFDPKDPDRPTIVKLKVRSDATAKSYRPDLFCKFMNIVGDYDPVTYLIESSFKNVVKTIQHINNENLAEKLKSDIVIIDEIGTISPSESLNFEYSELKELNKIIIRPHSFSKSEYQTIAFDELRNELKKFPNISVIEKNGYFYVTNILEEQIIKLSEHKSIRSIELAYDIKIHKSYRDFSDAVFVKPDYQMSEVKIGIIDSGIAENSILNDFVYHREYFVEEEFRNPKHGTFVASMIEFGNYFDKEYDPNPMYFKILDIVALPNDDEEFGSVKGFNAEDFKDILEKTMKKYSHEVKIWNLSLSSEACISDEKVSDLAKYLDFIQNKYEVQFITVTGNSSYVKHWPLAISEKHERITIPGESYMALTVGALAQKESTDSMVKMYEPSPFTRNGPGSNYILKPEIVDFGGNVINNHGRFRHYGNTGLSQDNKMYDDGGTSYASPKIAYKFAKIFDAIKLDNSKKLLLTKGILLHNAFINNYGIVKSSVDKEYYGLGKPSNDVLDFFYNNKNEITLYIDESMYRTYTIQMNEFPYPKCLFKDGKITGEIFITFIYIPAFDNSYNYRYSRSDMEVSFGFNKKYIDKKTGEVKEIYISLAPQVYNKYDNEVKRVTRNQKYGPIRNYYNNIDLDASDILNMRLSIKLATQDIDNTDNHKFTMLLTIRGSETDEVYNDMVVQLRENNFINESIEINERVKNILD